MKLYSQTLTSADVRTAFRRAREQNQADIYAVDVRDFTPRKGGHGVEFYAESQHGTRATGHRDIGSYPLDEVARAASWDAYGYVIAHLFTMEPDAKIGYYDGVADFRAKVEASSRKEPKDFLNVLVQDLDPVAEMDRIIGELHDSDCTFWACPGPEVPPVHMATCRVHWAMHDLQALRDKITQPPPFEHCVHCDHETSWGGGDTLTDDRRGHTEPCVACARLA